MIKSIDIVAFGKFAGLHMDFGPGMNMICQENGFGKTTLAAFIAAMFYGLPDTRKEDLAANPRKKYAPWGRREAFGGSMVFCYEGKTYRVTRLFGATAKSDEFSLTDTGTNKVFGEGKENLGERLFGLSYNDFLNSFFVPQEAVSMDSTDNFSAKLMQMTGGEKCDAAREKLDRLAVEIKQKVQRGGQYRGRLPDAQRRGALAAEALDAALRKESEILEGERGLERAKRELDEILKQKKSLQAELNAREEAKRKHEVVKGIRDREQTKRREALDSLPDCDFEAVPQKIERAKVLIAQSSRKDRRPVFFGAASAAFFLIAVMLAALAQFTYMGAALAVSALAALAAFLFWKRYNAGKTKLQKEIEELLLPVKVIDSYAQAIAELNGIYQKYLDLEKPPDMPPAVEFDESGYGELARQLEAAAYREKETERFLTETKTKIDIARGGLPDIAAIREEIAAAREDAQKLSGEYEALVLAKECVEKAKENLSRAYLPRMGYALSGHIKRITKGKFDSVEVRIEENKAAKSTQFALVPMMNGIPRDIGYFSKGEKEAALFCLRLALSELVYEGKMPFILVDDAFANYGEDSFAEAARIMRELGAGTQIFYFTCHERGRILI